MIHGMRSLISLWLLAVLFAGGGLSAAEGNLFETANQLYEEGKYVEAAAAYQSLLDANSASAAVYFNLGNARFKANQIGRAVVAYRNAAALSPRDPDVLANLRFARNQVQGPTLRPSRWQRIFNVLSLNEWTGLAMSALWLTFLLLALQQIRPNLRTHLRGSTLVLGGTALLLAAGLLAAVLVNPSRDIAVVVNRDVIAHQGPLTESKSAFTANDGAELRVLDRKDDWLQVGDDGNRVGWVKRNEVILL